MLKMNNTMSNQRYLEIILGPMFSGKTSRLIEVYNKCKLCNIPVVAINYDKDKRYDDVSICNHNGIKIPCIQCNKFSDLDDSNRIKDNTAIVEADVLLINEAQFFDDLYEFVERQLQDKKQIYICGLDGDYKRNSFGKILHLIPLCDKVSKLTAICQICKDGTPGIFTNRTSKDTAQEVIGGQDTYNAVCRNCFEKNN